MVTDLNAWTYNLGISTKDEYQFVYNRICTRKWVYLFLVLLFLILSSVILYNKSYSELFNIGILFVLVFYTAFYKCYVLSSAMYRMDFNFSPSFFLSLLYVLSLLTILPIIVSIIMAKTYVGFGIRKWQIDYNRKFYREGGIK